MFNKSTNFKKRLNREKIYLSSHSFETWPFIRNMKVGNVKFQLNVSKIMPGMQKNSQGRGV